MKIKTTITIALFILTTIVTYGQNLYINTFGNSKDKPIIFLHGGPGYNCVNFEASTGHQLAEKGFFVIVYDRRGEGRSKDSKARFTFKETFDDINFIFQKFNLKSATLIGHSFGGVIATLFTESNPEKVNSVILVGAPVSLPETFKSIITKSETIYKSKNDTVNLKYISMLKNLDKTSLEYSSFCFSHAKLNGFYSTKNPTDKAKLIYSNLKKDTIFTKYASTMSFEATQGFWKNEKYTTLDLSNNLKELQKQKVKIYGLYGKDDGLYSSQQVADLQNIIGYDNVKYFDNCSHNVFIDQQEQFIESVISWTK